MAVLLAALPLPSSDEETDQGLALALSRKEGVEREQQRAALFLWHAENCLLSDSFTDEEREGDEETS